MLRKLLQLHGMLRQVWSIPGWGRRRVRFLHARWFNRAMSAGTCPIHWDAHGRRQAGTLQSWAPMWVGLPLEGALICSFWLATVSWKNIINIFTCRQHRKKKNPAAGTKLKLLHYWIFSNSWAISWFLKDPVSGTLHFRMLQKTPLENVHLWFFILPFLLIFNVR